MTKIKEIRSETDRSILLDAGDVFSGDLYFTKWQGLADLKLMNSMGYDAMTSETMSLIKDRVLSPAS